MMDAPCGKVCLHQAVDSGRLGCVGPKEGGGAGGGGAVKLCGHCPQGVEVRLGGEDQNVIVSDDGVSSLFL